jgi:hypothetical protein
MTTTKISRKKASIPVATSIRWYATIVAMALIISFPQTRAQTIAPRTFPSFNCDRSSSVPIDLVSPEARSIVVDPNQDDCSWPSRDDRNHHLIFESAHLGFEFAPKIPMNAREVRFRNVLVCESNRSFIGLEKTVLQTKPVEDHILINKIFVVDCAENPEGFFRIDYRIPLIISKYHFESFVLDRAWPTLDQRAMGLETVLSVARHYRFGQSVQNIPADFDLFNDRWHAANILEDYDQQSRLRYCVGIDWISGHDVAQFQFVNQERTVGGLRFRGGISGGFGGVGRVPQTILHVLQLDEEQYRLANRDDEQTDCECTRRILRKPRPPSFLGVLFVLFATAGAAFGFFYGLCRLCGLTPTPGHRLREKYRDD